MQATRSTLPQCPFRRLSPGVHLVHWIRLRPHKREIGNAPALTALV
jgi:hypothetical protein